jgi:hypothetical protein
MEASPSSQCLFPLRPLHEYGTGWIGCESQSTNPRAGTSFWGIFDAFKELRFSLFWIAAILRSFDFLALSLRTKSKSQSVKGFPQSKKGRIAPLHR